MSVTAIHGFLSGFLLIYVPIDSQAYGFEWYVARLAQLGFAFIYAIGIGDTDELKKGILPLIFFGLSIGSILHQVTVWFNWLAIVYSFCLGILGLMLVSAKDRTAHIMAFYWLAQSAWNFGFVYFSMDPSSIIWKLNWFLPSALSVTAFLVLTTTVNSLHTTDRSST